MLDTAVNQREDAAAQTPSEDSRAQPSFMRKAAKALSFRNISAIYIFALMFIIFSIWVPNTFLQWGTWKAMFDSQAVTAILAIGLVVAVSAGAFDLAVGAELGVGVIFVAWLLVNKGLPIVPAIVATLVVGGLIGAGSGLLIVRVRIDPFIATLGVSSILTALTSWISGSQQILGLSQSFQNLGNNEVLGLAIPVYVTLALGLIVWYVLERTPAGRHVYATGGNIEAARLAGVRVSLVVVLSLVTCGVIAALAGILLSASLGTGDPTVGPPYLLPAFSAVFLGSTQFRGGRFNVWGTLLAVIVLATGVKGLQLGGAPVWIPDLFNGAALLIAVGLARYETGPTGAIRRLLRFDQADKASPDDPETTVAS